MLPDGLFVFLDVIYAFFLLKQLVDACLFSVLFDFALLEGFRAHSKHLGRNRIGKTMRSMMKISFFLECICKDIGGTFPFEHLFRMLQVFFPILFLISITIAVLFTIVTALFKGGELLNP